MRGRGQAALAGEFDEFVVAHGHLRERRAVGVAEHGHEHAIFGLDGKAHVDGARMHDFVADEPPGGRAIFAERDGEGAQGVERGAGFRVAGLAMREHGVEADGHADGGERPRPGAAHGVGHGHAHGGRGAELVVVERGEEFLEVLDRHAPRRAAAGDAREVGGVQAEFVHARLHPRRHEARARRMRRHRQAAHGGLHAGGFFLGRGRRAVRVGFGGLITREGALSIGACMMSRCNRNGKRMRIQCRIH